SVSADRGPTVPHVALQSDVAVLLRRRGEELRGRHVAKILFLIYPLAVCLSCRRVLLPCASFCEAAREGCEPVLQMFNASWPDFLRCSQFSKNTSSLSTPASPSSPSSLSSSSPLATTGLTPPACFTPRQIKGKP
ncbi:hypothetical protein XENOCAPTIV_022647, partial [Xenoophorus captivus]